jgi:hypothetical protein
LCRDHHRDLHRFGNEIAWWANLQISPTEIARDLWRTTPLDPDVSITRKISLQPPNEGIRVAEQRKNKAGEGRHVDPQE